MIGSGELGEFCGFLLAELGKTSWQVGLLILLVLGLQRLFSRWLSPRWCYALWLLVIARLFVPVVPQVPGGLVDWQGGGREIEETVASIASGSPAGFLDFSAPPRFSSRPVRSDPRPSESLDAGSESPANSDSVSGAEPAASIAASIAVSKPKRCSLAGPIVARAETTSTVPFSPRPEPVPANSFPWATALVAFWLASSLLLALRVLGGEWRFRRRLAGAERILDRDFLDLLEECRRELGVRREVVAIVTDLVATPAAWGVLRPRLLLPPHVLRNFDATELRCVLLHELCHLRRPDVLLNGALTGIGCLYWFHPLVRIAIARVRAAQEALRDWEALSTERIASPLFYAETVLKLLEDRSDAREPALALGFLRRGQDLKRRILMIADYRRRAPRTGMFGATLFVLLGWVSFTSAGSDLAPSTPSPGSPVPVAEEIEVTRIQPPPAWWSGLDEACAQTVSLHLVEADLDAAVAQLREQTGVNIVVQHWLRNELLESGAGIFSLNLEEITLELALKVLCRLLDQDAAYCYARNAICIGKRGDLPQLTDLRFYDVNELIDVEDPERLLELMQCFATSTKEVWYEENTSIMYNVYWDGLLALRQTDAVHEEVRSFLNHLLRRKVEREGREDRWRRELETRLATTVLDVKFEDDSVEDVVEALTATLEVPVIFEGERDPDSVSLTLNDVPALDVLAWVGEQLERNVLLRDGTVAFSNEVELTLELYDLATIDARVEDQEDPDAVFGMRESLDSMIRDEISPEIWAEYEGADLTCWNGLLIATATPAMHAEIAALLVALENALR
jgi:beta-lactamase regulating signal transducer with metallopeptidase domain